MRTISLTVIFVCFTGTLAADDSYWEGAESDSTHSVPAVHCADCTKNGKRLKVTKFTGKPAINLAHPPIQLATEANQFPSLEKRSTQALTKLNEHRISAQQRWQRFSTGSNHNGDSIAKAKKFTGWSKTPNGEVSHAHLEQLTEKIFSVRQVNFEAPQRIPPITTPAMPNRGTVVMIDRVKGTARLRLNTMGKLESGTVVEIQHKTFLSRIVRVRCEVIACESGMAIVAPIEPTQFKHIKQDDPAAVVD